MNGKPEPIGTFFDIKDSELTPLKDKIIVITGASSGIGLAFVKLCLDIGSKIVAGDVNECPVKNDNLAFVHTDVTDWKQQVALFKKAIELHGKVDHVFANAGIGPVDAFVNDELDSNGDLLPPNMRCVEIDLFGPIYTSKIGIHHLRKNPAGGSVVITASASSFSSFVATDYGTAKHGTLGLMRNLNANMVKTNIRVNCITPLWTASGLVDADKMKANIGIISQPPEAAAKSAMILMADETRRGQTMFSKRGMYKEVDSLLMKTIHGAMDPEEGDYPADRALQTWVDESVKK